MEWAEWEASGKPVPLDVGVAPKGNLVVIAGKVRGFTDEDARLGRDRRISHFATCPDAAQHRGRK